jgi:DNA-binding transcriptional ArsR family regulator
MSRAGADPSNHRVKAIVDQPFSRLAAEAISERLRVLGQPLRVRLIDLLDREGEMAVGALAERLGESVHNVSQHLAILRSATVVSRRHRGREVWYRFSCCICELSESEWRRQPAPGA